MSRKRVVYGADERGRPLSRWEDVPDEAPAYGHMQPAYDTSAERRRLTPEELAARTAVVERPDPLAPVHTERRPPVAAPVEEKPAVTDAVEPETIADAPSQLSVLAKAAIEAADAREELRRAEDRWDHARLVLAAAYAAVEVEVGPPDYRAVEPALAAVPDPVAPPPAAAPKRRRPGGDRERSESVEERGRRVVEVLDRHNGDTKLAGAELGMRGNVVARIAQSARAREAVAS